MKRNVAALSTLATFGLVMAAALPASAAVTYSSMAAPNVGDPAAIDTSSNTIYSIVDSLRSDPGTDYYDQTLTAVDAKTLKTKFSVLIFETSDESQGGPVVADLRVNSKTHTVWLSETNPHAGGWIEEVNGTTLKPIRTIAGTGGYSEPGEIAVNPTTNVTYAAWDWDAVAAADDSYTATAAAPYLSAINGSTGAVTTVALATPTYDDPYGEAGNIAFDTSNNGVYVSYNSHEYAYASSTLKLASSVAYPSTEQRTNPTITADGSTHTIYAAGASGLYKITGSTNKIALTVSASNNYGVLPVVDPTIKTLYVGTSVYSETTLAKSGTLPHPASSVNGSTHAIYSPGYVVTRKG